MLVGVPEWQGIISPTLDAAGSLAVFEAGEGGYERRGTAPLSQLFPPSRAQEIAASGIGVLICGAVSSALAAMIGSRGISVVPFVSGPVEEVIQAFVEGTLSAPRFALPGCGRMRRRRRGGKGGGGRGFGGRGRGRL